ncbi:MAG: hypothetical protein IPN76_13430 [Saprospiraceae bacterium]|nr:hypothetical protein [Saprospiraceae bacterium]
MELVRFETKIVKVGTKDTIKKTKNLKDVTPKIGSITNSTVVIGDVSDSNLDNLQKVKNDVPKSYYSQSNNEKKKIFKLELSHKIGLASLTVALLVLFFGNNLWERIGKKAQAERQGFISNSEQKNELKDSVILDYEFKGYQETKPLVDRGLLIKRHYNEFILGGANVDSIKVNFASKHGEAIRANKSHSEGLKFETGEEPYIEILYKGNFYSIEFLFEDFDYKVIVKRVIEPTLFLRDYDDI